jgi:hypothetical protein
MNIKQYLRDKGSVSKSGAILSLIRRVHAGIFNRIPIIYPVFKAWDALYHSKIMRIMKKVEKSSLINLNFIKKRTVSKGTFFYFWWDGIDQLPDICKKCLESLRQNSNGHDVIFLDKNNFSSFVDIPSFILEKFQRGNISITLFSDILRLFLLSIYDCIWVDSTMYFVKPIPEEAFESRFLSCNSKQITKDIHNASAIVNYHYPVYFFLSNEGFIFKDVCTILVNYWNLYEHPIDYFQTNYIFDYVIKRNTEYKHYISSMKEFCPRVEWLLPHVREKYDRKVFETIQSQTFFFKLNWKLLKDEPVCGTYLEMIKNGEKLI